MMMSPAEDYEYGESRQPGARRYERLANWRFAINGNGALPSGFDHVKLHHKAPKTMS